MTAPDFAPFPPERLVALAAETVDWAQNNARRDPERAVMAQALRLRRALSPDGLAARTLAAVPIRCRVESVELVESSQRYDVRFTPTGGRGGEEAESEHATSDRLDGPCRAHVLACVQDLKPGDEAVIYKLTEDGGDGRRYRHFTWIERLARGTAEGNRS